MTRMLNEIDAAKLNEADQDVTAQKMGLALQLLQADGRLDQYVGSRWADLPPMFRWMAHELLENAELRERMIRILEGDRWTTTNRNPN